MPPSGLVVSQYQGVAVVNFRDSSILDGAAVQSIADELYELVDQQAQRKIVLDFSQVRFLSSMMLGVLISLQKKSQDIKGKMVLCGLRADLYRVFEIMKLDKMLTFAKDEAEAMQKLEARTL